MATHRLNKSRDTTWEITTSGDTWILGEQGVITGTDINGIHADNTIDKASVQIDGKIDLDGLFSSGVHLQTNDAAVVKVNGTGRIFAGIPIWCENTTSSVSIVNNGRLAGDIGVFAFAAQDGIEIRNTGIIRASDVGIFSSGAKADIFNSGVVKAGERGIVVRSNPGDNQPLEAENAVHIVNSGKISGLSASVVANVAVNIRNKGTLSGDVFLQDGDDVFNSAGGKVNGAIFGGNGDDLITLGSPGSVYIEEIGEGIDTVRINATYSLGENIEHLALLGRGNHIGSGNSLDNTITGNRGANALFGLAGNDRLDGGKGRDALKGGAGTDTFVFKAGSSRDTITDFQDGMDLIDLTDFAIASFNDLEITQSESGVDFIISLGETDILILKYAADNGTVLTAADFTL